MQSLTDLVHLLLDVDPTIDVVVRKIKGYTADTIGKEYPWMKSRPAILVETLTFHRFCGGGIAGSGHVRIVGWSTIWM